MDCSFEEISSILDRTDKLWVRLRSGVKVCLLRVADRNAKMFHATFTPCIQNPRITSINYEQLVSFD
jgi:hypothetical protein